MAEFEKKPIERVNQFRVRNLFYMLAAVLFFLAIVSHNAGDAAVLAGGVNSVVGNWIGNIGARVACGLFLRLGLASYVLAIIVLLAIPDRMRYLLLAVIAILASNITLLKWATAAGTAMVWSTLRRCRAMCSRSKQYITVRTNSTVCRWKILHTVRVEKNFGYFTRRNCSSSAVFL